MLELEIVLKLLWASLRTEAAPFLPFIPQLTIEVGEGVSPVVAEVGNLFVVINCVLFQAVSEVLLFVDHGALDSWILVQRPVKAGKFALRFQEVSFVLRAVLCVLACGKRSHGWRVESCTAAIGGAADGRFLDADIILVLLLAIERGWCISQSWEAKLRSLHW